MTVELKREGCQDVWEKRFVRADERALKDLRVARRAVRWLLAAGRLAAEAKNARELIDRAADLIRDATGADWIGIVGVRSDRAQLISLACSPARAGFPIARSRVDFVLDTGLSVATCRRSDAPVLGCVPWFDAASPRARGAIGLQRSAGAEPFTTADLTLAAILARQVGALVVAARCRVAQERAVGAPAADAPAEPAGRPPSGRSRRPKTRSRVRPPSGSRSRPASGARARPGSRGRVRPSTDRPGTRARPRPRGAPAGPIPVSERAMTRTTFRVTVDQETPDPNLTMTSAGRPRDRRGDPSGRIPLTFGLLFDGSEAPEDAE